MRTYKNLFVISLLLMSFSLKAQELGYLSGVSKLGISQNSFQPLYGFSVGKVFNQYFAVETNLYYSQRQIDFDPLADYITFTAMPQIGYFNQDKKFAVYCAPAFALNPALYHSNRMNHTYFSIGGFVGARYEVFKKIILEARGGYDNGLAPGYIFNSIQHTYKGVVVQAALKFNLSCK